MDLNQIKKKDCYNVPDQYFEELPKIVLQNIAKQKKVITLRRSMIAISSIAASIILIVGIIQLRPTTQVPVTAHLSDTLADQMKKGEILTATATANPECDAMTTTQECPVCANASVKTAPKHCPVHHTDCEHAHIEEIDYQMILAYQDELSLNSYLNATCE